MTTSELTEPSDAEDLEDGVRTSRRPDNNGIEGRRDDPSHDTATAGTPALNKQPF